MASQDSGSSSVVLVESNMVCDRPAAVLTLDNSSEMPISSSNDDLLRTTREDVRPRSAVRYFSTHDQQGVPFQQLIDAITDPSALQDFQNCSDAVVQKKSFPNYLPPPKMETSTDSQRKCIFCENILTFSRPENDFAKKVTECDDENKSFTSDDELLISRRRNSKTNDWSGNMKNLQLPVGNCSNMTDSKGFREYTLEIANKKRYQVINVTDNCTVDGFVKDSHDDVNSTPAVRSFPPGLAENKSSMTTDSDIWQPARKIDRKPSKFRTMETRFLDILRGHHVCYVCSKKFFSTMYSGNVSLGTGPIANVKACQGESPQRDADLASMYSKDDHNTRADMTSFVVDLPSNFPPFSPSQGSVRSASTSDHVSAGPSDGCSEDTKLKMLCTAPTFKIADGISLFNEDDSKRNSLKNYRFDQNDTVLLARSGRHAHRASKHGHQLHGSTCAIDTQLIPDPRKPTRPLSLAKDDTDGSCAYEVNMVEFPADARVAARQMASSINQMVGNLAKMQNGLVSSIDARRRHVVDRRALLLERMRVFEVKRRKILRDLEKDQALLQQENSILKVEEEALDSEGARLLLHYERSMDVLSTMRENFGSFIALLAQREQKRDILIKLTGSSLSNCQEHHSAQPTKCAAENSTALSSQNVNLSGLRSSGNKRKLPLNHASAPSVPVPVVNMKGNFAGSFNEDETQRTHTLSKSLDAQVTLPQLGLQATKRPRFADIPDIEPAIENILPFTDHAKETSSCMQDATLSSQAQRLQPCQDQPIEGCKDRELLRTDVERIAVLSDLSVKVVVPSTSGSSRQHKSNMEHSKPSAPTQPRRRLPPRKQMIR